MVERKVPALQGDVRVEGSEYDLLLSNILETSANGGHRAFAEHLLLTSQASLSFPCGRQSDMLGHRVHAPKAAGKRAGEEDIEQSSYGGTSIHRHLIT